MYQRSIAGVVGLFVLLTLQQAIGAESDAIAELRKSGQAFSQVAKAASPAVVSIRTERSVSRTAQPIDPFLERFFGNRLPAPDDSRKVHGQGSGFIFDKSGFIMTNAHVVADSSSVSVTLSDGRTFDGTIVGVDVPTDVAVIRISGENLPVVAFGDSQALEVGEWVLALGNPFGLSHTLTVGVVSAKGRSSLGINEYENFIQTDAAINPGNSGGPLLNLSGEVVGMNTAIFSQSGGSVGIGFAIPANMANQVQAQLREHGAVTRSYLGVTIQPLTAELADSFGLPNNQGALISQVEPGSPADQAGMLTGDVIVEVDGATIQTTADLRNRIALRKPGTEVRLMLVRDGKSRQVRVLLAAQLASLTAAGSAISDPWGLTLSAATASVKEQFGLKDDVAGVVIVAVADGSSAANAGLRPGMVLHEVNRQTVRTVREAMDLLAESGQRALLRVVDSQSSAFVVMTRKK